MLVLLHSFFFFRDSQYIWISFAHLLSLPPSCKVYIYFCWIIFITLSYRLFPCFFYGVYTLLYSFYFWNDFFSFTNLFLCLSRSLFSNHVWLKFDAQWIFLTKKYNYFFFTALYFIFLGINCCLFQLHSCLAILFQSSFSTLCAFLKALIAFLISCSLVWRVRLEFSSALCLHFSGVLSKYFSPIFFCNTLCG